MDGRTVRQRDRELKRGIKREKGNREPEVHRVAERDVDVDRGMKKEEQERKSVL